MNPADKALRTLEADIHTLRNAYARYFRGAEKIPPVKKHQALKRALKELAARNENNTAICFKLNTLQSALVSYEANWRRLEKRREDALLTKSKTPVVKTQTAPSPPALAVTDPDKLYQEYTALRAQLGAAAPKALSLENFKATILQQTAAIKERYHCPAVSFSVTLKDGKPILKATPQYPEPHKN